MVKMCTGYFVSESGLNRVQFKNAEYTKKKKKSEKCAAVF